MVIFISNKIEILSESMNNRINWAQSHSQAEQRSSWPKPDCKWLSNCCRDGNTSSKWYQNSLLLSIGKMTGALHKRRFLSLDEYAWPGRCSRYLRQNDPYKCLLWFCWICDMLRGTKRLMPESNFLSTLYLCDSNLHKQQCQTIEAVLSCEVTC